LSKLTIIRGLQASGKDTLARAMVAASMEDSEPFPAMIVNRDHLRFMAGLDTTPGPYESTITLQQHALIRAGLKADRHVISSDTNLAAKYVKEMAKIADFFGAEVEVVDMDTPLEVCILRDGIRGENGGHEVGSEVIRRTHKRYFANGKFPANPLIDRPEPVKLEPYRRDPSKPKAKIYDVDGTLMNHEGKRSPYDYTSVHLDEPHEDVVQQMRDDYALGYNLIVLSGREDSCRQATEESLRLHTHLPVGYDIPVYMRKVKDDRVDFIVKYELFMTHIAPYFNVVGVYDDRNQVVSMWRSIGVRCYQVNYGTF
jgi:Straboviridae polynucleotide kinase